MRTNLHRKALYLSYFTAGYNIAEAAASIVFGWLSGSVALIAFGLDSLVESLSAGIMIWRFSKHSMTPEEEEKIEKRATRLVAITFFILSAYVLYESITKLVYSEVPDTSLPGIIIAIASIIVMPILFRLKYKVGQALNSSSLIADSKETLACMVLSVALLIGLGANYLFGFWQADPIVGLLVAAYLIKEGYETLTEDEDED